MNSPELAEEPYKRMWSKGISIVDLHILQALAEGASRTTLDKYLKAKGLNFPRSRLEKRVEELKDQGIIIKEATVLFDPTQIFDYIFVTFVKIHLPFFYPTGTMDWGKAFREIVSLDEKYKILSMLFTIEGTGEYDLVLFMFVNDINDYYSFVKELTQKGWIEKVDGKRVHSAKEAGFLFQPVLLPNIEKYQRAVREYKDKLDQMLQEEREGKQGYLEGKNES